MVNKSSIEWTDGTWNPVTGCTKVTPGCDRCYAEAMTNRFKRHPFTQVTLHPDRLDEPAKLRRGRRIFVCSMGDLFHKDVPWKFICQVFEVMGRCPHHTFQVLTKRPGRMAYFAQEVWPEWTNCHPVGPQGWPLNVWAGVSVDTERTVRWLDVLARVPALVRFVSYEPALGPVDFGLWVRPDWAEPVIHWVIAGGESGPGARPSHPDWFRRVRDDCAIAGVPFFFKQWGQYMPRLDIPGKTPPGSTIWIDPHGTKLDWQQGDVPPGSTMVTKVGKKAAGALLDGREHREFPRVLEVANA